MIVSCLMLASCGSQKSNAQKDAFEIAKSHIWGDKINGCDYQMIAFDDNYFYRENSSIMVNKIKSLSDSKTFNYQKMLANTLIFSHIFCKMI
jgi:hypothetical protein